MAKLPDAEVIIFGLLISVDEKRNFETKLLTGYRATIIGPGGGAAIVNFTLMDVVPRTPMMTSICWRVRTGSWSMDGNSGISTKYLGEVYEPDLLAIAAALTDNGISVP